MEVDNFRFTPRIQRLNELEVSLAGVRERNIYWDIARVPYGAILTRSVTNAL